tara:strand:- start:216 stop:527 length:312 start_codon:yes stop_codon:yes gene_type:complete
MYRYVCDASNMHITVDVYSSRIAHITLFLNEEPVISRKYLFDEVDQQRANELVVAFCTLLSEDGLREARFENEIDTSAFFAESIRSSLKKAYTKLGLLLWQRK